jgi:maltose alpha-D-glucosyltransferase/alpha-amylase
MLQYGDEIGMGDDLSLPERECARTPMQWTADRHGGFSYADTVVRPVIDDAEYGFMRVNAADQRRDRDSLLNWLERMIRARKECPEISWGKFSILPSGTAEVLVIRYDWRDTSLLTVHNFDRRTRTARFRVDVAGGDRLVDVFTIDESRADASGEHEILLEEYGHRWFRVGATDNALNRASREQRD